MKKLSTFFIVAVWAFMAISASAQTNLLAGWDANGAIGATSKPNSWGWACSYSGTSWGTANSTGTVRYMDLTATTSPASYLADGTTVFVGRTAMCRWDGNYWASVWTLGKYNGTNTTVQPIPLTAGKSYTFSADIQWWSNGYTPTYSFDITTDATGADLNAVLDTKSSTISSKNKFQAHKQPFTCMTTGNYYIIIKQTSGTASASGTLLGLANVSLTEDVSVGVETIKTDDFKVRPVTGGITIDFNLVKPAQVEFAVFDISGKQFIKEKGIFEAVSNQKVLNIALSKGLYLVKMNVEGQTVTKKIVL